MNPYTISLIFYDEIDILVRLNSVLAQVKNADNVIQTFRMVLPARGRLPESARLVLRPKPGQIGPEALRCYLAEGYIVGILKPLLKMFLVTFDSAGMALDNKNTVAWRSTVLVSSGARIRT